MTDNFRLPLGFILNNIDLDWSDVKYGLDNRFLDGADAIKVAERLVSTNVDVSERAVELASLLHAEEHRVADLIAALSAGADPASSQKKWLYLILAWLYRERDAFDDVFSIIDEVYADFNYPEEMSSFVGYMPPVDGYRPEDHTNKENRERLIRLWRAFLESEALKYSSGKKTE